MTPKKNINALSLNHVTLLGRKLCTTGVQFFFLRQRLWFISIASVLEDNWFFGEKRCLHTIGGHGTVL
jgi:hypothetical protein